MARADTVLDEPRIAPSVIIIEHLLEIADELDALTAEDVWPGIKLWDDSP